MSRLRVALLIIATAGAFAFGAYRQWILWTQ